MIIMNTICIINYQPIALANTNLIQILFIRIYSHGINYIFY